MYCRNLYTCVVHCLKKQGPSHSQLPSLFLDTEGLATEGLATEGLATEGLATEGLATEGLATETNRSRAIVLVHLL